MSTLTDLAFKYGCDKLHAHSYLPVYESLFKDRTVTRLLEIGIGFEGLMKSFVPFYIHGASLKMWESFFPEAEIYACDVRMDTLVNEGRIHSCIADQSSLRDLAQLLIFAGGSFDVIIDDGSHQTAHQIFTAEYLLPTMSKGSLYVIEDCYPDTGAKMAEMFNGRLVVGDKRPDDCLVVIQL